MIVKKLQQHIDDSFHGSKPAFAYSIYKTNKQIHRYLEMGCYWIGGAVVQVKHAHKDSKFYENTT